MDKAGSVSDSRGPHPVRSVTIVVAAMFVAVGVLGFVPGITTGYSGMTAAGHESSAMLFGVFQVSVLHNIVHLLFGVVGFIMARAVGSATAFLVGGGVVYLLLLLYGLLVDHGSAANFVPLNNADNLLHLVLGVVMIGLGATLPRMSPDRRQP